MPNAHNKSEYTIDTVWNGPVWLSSRGIKASDNGGMEGCGVIRGTKYENVMTSELPEKSDQNIHLTTFIPIIQTYHFHPNQMYDVQDQWLFLNSTLLCSRWKFTFISQSTVGIGFHTLVPFSLWMDASHCWSSSSMARTTCGPGDGPERGLVSRNVGGGGIKDSGNFYFRKGTTRMLCTRKSTHHSPIVFNITLRIRKIATQRRSGEKRAKRVRREKARTTWGSCADPMGRM